MQNAESTSTGARSRATASPSPPTSSETSGETPEVFARLADPAHNVAVWRRELPAEITCVLAAAPLVPGCIDRVVRMGAEAPLAPFGELVPEVARAWFLRDLELLARAFQQISGASAFAACLSFVDSDSCRKFHVDHLRLRLLCTYRGPGTEWVDDADVDRNGFDLDDHDAEAVNARIVRSPDAVRRAHAGDVVLLKGETWPGNGGRGAVHRSPPVVAQKLVRLVFKLSLR